MEKEKAPEGLEENDISSEIQNNINFATEFIKTLDDSLHLKVNDDCELLFGFLKHKGFKWLHRCSKF